MRFDYHVDPFRPIWFAGAVIVFVIVVIVLRLAFVATQNGLDNSLWFVLTVLMRLILIAIPAGWGLWFVLRFLRSGRGLTLRETDLVVENPFTRRSRSIPYAAVLGYSLTDMNGLALAYEKPGEPETPISNRSQLALSEARPLQGPRRLLIVMPQLNHADDLVKALAVRIRPDLMPPEDLLMWSERRQMRNKILLLLFVLGTPFYVVIIGRIIAAFLAVGIR